MALIEPTDYGWPELPSLDGGTRMFFDPVELQMVTLDDAQDLILNRNGPGQCALVAQFDEAVNDEVWDKYHRHIVERGHFEDDDELPF